MLENNRFHKSVMDAKGVNQLFKKKKLKQLLVSFSFTGVALLRFRWSQNFSANSSGTAQLSPSGSLENNTKLSKQTALYQFNN